MNNLKNKIAVITGSNSGIGYATAKELKEQGAKVIITGRRKEAITQAATELGVTAIVADQSNIEAIENLTNKVKDTYGKIDILFINAGVVKQSTIEQATEAHFDEIININFKGAYFTLNRFIPLLNDGASVILLSSIVATKTFVGSSVYSSSKAALNSVMKTAAIELAPRNIRVNAVSPGPTQTEIMNKAGLDVATIKTIKAGLVDRIPLKLVGTAEDVAGMVAYLSGDAAKFITGTEIIMDGGMVLA
ncbi:SDR family oxidoreductase [Pedobacter sp. PAMC26386]|nr:SDR family oxidoreductase [Pedobacter sp. PAMC26386]